MRIRGEPLGHPCIRACIFAAARFGAALDPRFTTLPNCSRPPSGASATLRRAPKLHLNVSAPFPVAILLQVLFFLFYLISKIHFTSNNEYDLLRLTNSTNYRSSCNRNYHDAVHVDVSLASVIGVGGDNRDFASTKLQRQINRRDINNCFCAVIVNHASDKYI